MLCELRTGLLSPKNFYELYIMVADEMRHLEQYFYDEMGRGRRMVELYELVQHAGNIVPRLFLLITVGSVYIRSKEAPARDILKDLVEMCRGVQQPMRGLFLRNYLLQCARDKLPDLGSEYGNEVVDGIDFLMHNFAEMNKLWVRMQHQGPVRDRERRERERLDLRILVGTNLVRLSNMEGIDSSLYKTDVLPRILEQVVSCKDTIAQQYLIECIIQVFPDEFHLATLEDLLGTTGQLQAGVDIKAILVALMNRLAAFAKNEPGAIPADVDMLGIFQSHVSNLGTSNLDLSAILDLQVALVNFALGFAPDRLDFVDGTLGSVAQTLVKAKVTLVEGKAQDAMVSLLRTPMLSNGKPLTILALENYAGLMAYLGLESRREVATLVARLTVSSPISVSTPEETESLLSFLQPLVKDVVEDAATDADTEDDEDFETGQHLVAALIHRLDNTDTQLVYQMYVVARKHFGLGGPKRIKHTLVPLVFRAMILVRKIKDLEKAGAAVAVASKKVLGFILETIKGLASAEPLAAMRLLLQGAMCANECGEDKIAYEYVSQALQLYEDDISDSRAQMELVLTSASTLHVLNSLDPEDYDTLITNVTKHAVRLLKKPDQCRAVYSCSHLFWNKKVKYEDGKLFEDGKRVLDCLQRALKIADVCMQASTNVHLFVEILNRYLYYLEAGNEKITIKYIQGLLDLVSEHLTTMDPGAEADSVRGHLNQTLTHMRLKKEQGEERFAQLSL